MTQDEVDLIYEYLHENYRYEDGNLILTKKKTGCRIGREIGRFIYWGRTRTQMTTTIRVNKIKYGKPLSHFIYLFHKKEFPDCIKYLDGNATNNKIENLKSITRKEIEYQKSLLKKGYYEVPNKNGPIRFQIVFRSYSCPNYKIQGGVFYCKEKANKVFLKLKEIDFNHDGDEESLKKKIMEYKTKNQPSKKGFYKEGKKYISRVCIDGRYKYLGSYNTPEEAHEAYIKAKEDFKK